MHEQIEKIRRNKKRMITNSVTQNKSKRKQGFGVVNDQPEAHRRLRNKEGIHTSEFVGNRTTVNGSQASINMSSKHSQLASFSHYPVTEMNRGNNNILQRFKNNDMDSVGQESFRAEDPITGSIINPMVYMGGFGKDLEIQCCYELDSNGRARVYTKDTVVRTLAHQLSINRGDVQENNSWYDPEEIPMQQQPDGTAVGNARAIRRKVWWRISNGGNVTWYSPMDNELREVTVSTSEDLLFNSELEYVR